jgi:hypothetical protein
MKKLLFIAGSLFLLISFLISPGIAAEWNSDEGMQYLMDEEYQVKIAIIRCMDRYENENMVRQCAHNQAEAYYDVVSSMIFLFKGDQDGFDVKKPLSCLVGGLDRFWDSEYDSANWISIQTYTSRCMDQ